MTRDEAGTLTTYLLTQGFISLLWPARPGADGWAVQFVTPNPEAQRRLWAAIRGEEGAGR